MRAANSAHDGLEAESRSNSAASAVPPLTEQDVRVGESGPRDGVALVARNRAPIIVDRRLQIRDRAPLGAVAAQHVHAIRLDVVRIPFREVPLAAGEPELEAGGDLARNFLLHGEHVRELAIVVALPPDLGAVRGVGKFGRHDERVALLQDASGQHGVHAEVAAKGGRVDAGAPVAKRRRPPRTFNCGSCERLLMTLSEMPSPRYSEDASAAVSGRIASTRIDPFGSGR